MKYTIRVTCNIVNCKTTKSTHSAIVVTRRSAGLFLLQHNNVAGYLNMQGTATVAFLAMHMATGSSTTKLRCGRIDPRYGGIYFCKDIAVLNRPPAAHLCIIISYNFDHHSLQTIQKCTICTIKH